MRLGLIARADSRGLGVQTKAVHDQLHPAKTMVVDCPSAQPLPIRRDWYPDATWIKGLPSHADMRTWLRNLDVVYTAETGYGAALWDEAERAGVRTVLHANYEFLNPHDRPTQWAAPSLWHINNFPTGTVHLPVPIETHRFTNREPAATARRFLHIIGRPAAHDRNGTTQLLEALRHVTTNIEVTIKCQDRQFLAGIDGYPINRRKVRLHLDGGDTANYWDNYTSQDVLVMPRRFGGLCLPVNEALGAGMPVIMPDIEPNNLWLPTEWLAPATHAGSFMAKQRINYHTTNPRALAALIDRHATDEQFHTEAQRHAQKLRDELSWQAWKPTYEKALAG